MTQDLIGVLGGGAWGTALACLLADREPEVPLWAHEAETVEAINTRRENPVFLPDIPMPENLHATADIAELAACNTLLMVVPSQFARAAMTELARHASGDLTLVLCSKGLERDSLKFMSAVASECLPEAAIAVLSGPSFAADVARGLPTAVTLACADATRGEALCMRLSLIHI